MPDQPADDLTPAVRDVLQLAENGTPEQRARLRTDLAYVIERLEEIQQTHAAPGEEPDQVG